jgi:hypothetical protein
VYSTRARCEIFQIKSSKGVNIDQFCGTENPLKDWHFKESVYVRYRHIICIRHYIPVKILPRILITFAFRDGRTIALPS